MCPSLMLLAHATNKCLSTHARYGGHILTPVSIHLHQAITITLDGLSHNVDSRSENIGRRKLLRLSNVYHEQCARDPRSLSNNLI